MVEDFVVYVARDVLVYDLEGSLREKGFRAQAMTSLRAIIVAKADQSELEATVGASGLVRGPTIDENGKRSWAAFEL